MLIVVDLDNHITQLGNIFDIANLLASPEVTNVTVYYRSLGQFSADGGDYVFSIKDKGGCEVTTAVAEALEPEDTAVEEDDDR